MISAPLRVSAVGSSFSLFSGAPSSVSVDSSKPSKSSRPSSRVRIRCAAAATAAAPPAVARGSAGAGATLYEVLGLRAGATGREIKAAYRRLARERHPDAAGPAAAPGAAAEFVRLHHAYATLSDPDTRARYDRAAVPAVAPRPWSSGGGGVYGRPRRTWETDQCW